MSYFSEEPRAPLTSRAFPLIPPVFRRKRSSFRSPRRALFWPAMLPLIILSSLLVNWIFLAQDVYAAPLAPTAQGGHLTFQQFVNEGQPSKAPHGKFVRPAPPKPGKLHHPQATTLPGAEPATMKPITQVLSSAQTDATMVGSSAVKPLDFLSNDGRFEVQIPAGAFDLTKAQNSQGVAPTGTLTLRISQVHGHEMGLLNSLGAYQIQVLDSQNVPLKKMALRTPITVIYHYQPWEMQALDLNPDQISLSWPGLLVADTQAKASTANDVVPFTNNTAAHTLTAQTSVVDMSASLSVGSEPNNQSAPTPHFASVQGNSGNLSYSYPLQIAPGTAGFAPDLQLVYSSGAANGRHSQVSPADDAGDGWSVSLGAITASQQLSPSGSSAETVYSISGPDHISDRLIPDPNPNNAGYFFTEHISHLSIHQVNNGTTGQPCFHVYDTSGNYYEYGCTADSLQYYTTSAGRVNYAWDLDDEGSATQGPSTPSEAIKPHYLQDTATVNGYTSVRDAGLEQVVYGNYTENPSTFHVVGTIDFLYHAPTATSTTNGINQVWATAYGTNYHCLATPPTSTTLRCDDPVARGSQAAPATMSTLTLDTIETFVGDDSTASHLDYSYALSYNQDAPFVSCKDPESQVSLYCAGDHTLASITPSAYLGGTAHAQQPTVFTYTSAQDSYVDSSEKNSSGNTFSNQATWQYLTSLDDEQTGVGESITYGTAWNNTHGTPQQSDGDDRYEPLYCSWYGGCTGSFANPNDKAWTVQVVTQIQKWGTDSSSTKLAPATINYDYNLTYVGDGCPSDGSLTDCVGYEWYPSGDTNWTNYYDAEFRGFATVYITSPAGNLTVDNYASTEGLDTPATDAENYLTGTLKDEEVYQGNSASGPLLQKTKNTYAGDDNGGSAGSCTGPASEEYAICENVLLYHTVHTYEGTSNDMWAEQDFYYDDYDLTNGLSVGKGHYHNMTEEDDTYSNAPETRELWTYSPNDQNTGGFQYYDVNKATASELIDSSNHIWDCTTTAYDEGVGSGVPTPAGGWPTTVQTYSNANCSGKTSPMTTTYTGYDAYGNEVGTVDGVGATNASAYASVGCTPGTTPVIKASAWANTRYTSCMGYDGMSALPTSQTNALGQAISMVYDPTQQDQPTRVTDANNQPTTTSYSYDSSGNSTFTTTQPQESNSYSSQSSAVSHCTASSTLPCFEIDNHTSMYSNVVARTFYDNQGRAVETRTPGPTPGDDTVVFTTYNDQNNSVSQSVPFQVADGSGWLDPAKVTDINGTIPGVTVTFYDALGRAIAIQDPNLGSSQEPGLVCSSALNGKYTSCVNYTLSTAAGTSDTNIYESATSVDPNGHATVSYSNALGEGIYGEVDSGVNGGTLTLQKLTTTQYNALGKPTSIAVTDEQPQAGQSATSVTTSMTYDDLGRLLTTTDPDQGTFTYSYDADSRVTSVVQTSGSNSRTIGTNYDLLGRVGCEQTAAPTFNTTGACTAGNPLLVNTYDTTELGVQGTTDFPVGHLTQSVATTYYPDNSSATVTEQYQTDQRGRTTNTQMLLSLPSGWNVTSSLPSYQLAVSYNDADQVTTTSATAGTASYSFTNVYDGTSGSLQGLGSGSIASSSLASLAYNEYAQISGITLLNGSSTQIASEQYSYDADQRPTSLTTNWLPGSGNSGEILGSTRAYDNAGNVTSLNTYFVSVPGQSASGGTETQNFCYDEQNHLIWAGNGGTQPGAGNGTCGSGTLSSGLVGGGYTSPYTYTNLGQLWQGPVNGKGVAEQYLYCNTAPHQLTGIYPTGTTCSNKGSATATYSASYDAWGNETSRTYNSVTATLSYDPLNRMTEYNSGANNQEFYLYDGSGNRVLKRTINSGNTTLTTYAFGLQELSYTGSGAFASQTDYYAISGHLIGSTDDAATIYDLTDAEGSVLTSLSINAVLGEQIYDPYGNQRYTQGTMGTDKGYTGQFQDALTGFDYYNARYYDPVMGQFLSADNVQGNAQGADPYAYVDGNPETLTDPSGHVSIWDVWNKLSPADKWKLLKWLIDLSVTGAGSLPGNTPSTPQTSGQQVVQPSPQIPNPPSAPTIPNSESLKTGNADENVQPKDPINSDDSGGSSAPPNSWGSKPSNTPKPSNTNSTPSLKRNSNGGYNRYNRLEEEEQEQVETQSEGVPFTEYESVTGNSGGYTTEAPSEEEGSWWGNAWNSFTEAWDTHVWQPTKSVVNKVTSAMEEGPNLSMLYEEESVMMEAEDD